MAKTLTSKLLAWFRREKRDLPWRQNPTPYSVWISEVMLQQTVVKAVIPYFEKWLKRFPTLQTLANARGEEVLKNWEGLGYYSRARNLHQAAKLVVKEHGGKLPGDLAGLTSLPGIGDYTASAILSIAFGKPYPVVDANVRRVVSRLLAITKKGTSAETDIREFLNSQISKRNPGAFNEALMELGQRVCTSRNPRCELCPLQDSCLAFAKGIQNSIPASKSLQKIKLESVALIILNGNRILAARQEHGLFAGLWILPRIGTGRGHREEIDEFIRQNAGTNFEYSFALTPRTHSYTKFSERLIPRVYTAKAAKAATKPSRPWSWIGVQQLSRHPFSSTDRRIIEELLEQVALRERIPGKKHSKISI